MSSFMRQPSQPIGSTGPTAGPDKLKDHPNHVCPCAGLTEYQTVQFPIWHAVLIIKTWTTFEARFTKLTYLDTLRCLV